MILQRTVFGNFVTKIERRELRDDRLTGFKLELDLRRRGVRRFEPTSSC